MTNNHHIHHQVPPPTLQVKKQNNQIEHLKKEMELLKRDNLLMSKQLDQVERQHTGAVSMMEKQQQAELARYTEDLKRKDTVIHEMKGKTKQRKAKVQGLESQAAEIAQQRDQYAQ